MRNSRSSRKLPAAWLLHAALRVGGGEHAHVDAPGLRGADPLQFAGFKHAQQLGLLAQGNVGDFIEEERAAVGQFEAADAVGARIGECAFDVAEYLAFEGAFRQPAGIDGHQRHARARRSGVQQLGDDLFAGAVFAGDEHVGVGGANLGDQLQHRLHRGRAGDKVRHAFGAQQAVFEFELARAAQGLV